MEYVSIMRDEQTLEHKFSFCYLFYWTVTKSVSSDQTTLNKWPIWRYCWLSAFRFQNHLSFLWCWFRNCEKTMFIAVTNNHFFRLYKISGLLLASDWSLRLWKWKLWWKNFSQNSKKLGKTWINGMSFNLAWFYSLGVLPILWIGCR
jgi:hypothetical protein